MTDLDRTKLRQLDLTVLLVFLGLMRHRRATAVAAELGLTPSSISHALGRLRDVFGDELFRRRPHGLEPTGFADAIEPGLRAAVEAMDAALRGPPAFDPATSTAHLRLSARDHAIGTFLPGVLARLRADAPGLTLSVTSDGRAASLAALREGKLDIAMGHLPDPGRDLLSRTLREEGYLVAARADHPILQGPLTLDAFLAANHILTSTSGDLRGVVDEALAAQGLVRRVRVAVPQFFPVLALLAKGNDVATLPATLVREHAERFGLRFAEPPLPLHPFVISAVIHARDARSPLVAWALEHIEAGGRETTAKVRPA